MQAKNRAVSRRIAPFRAESRRFAPFRSQIQLIRLHIVAKQRFLIADVKLPIGDHRMRPAIEARPVRLIEPPRLMVSRWRSVDQRDRPLLIFLSKVKMPVGVSDRALAEAILVLPNVLSRKEILANPPDLI